MNAILPPGTAFVNWLVTCKNEVTRLRPVDRMTVARKFLISGMVQGVGFRFFAQRSAARHQIRGYVKNLEDGRVEAWAQGPAKAVESFGHDLAAGPTYSRVRDVEELVVEPVREYSTFRIER